MSKSLCSASRDSPYIGVRPTICADADNNVRLSGNQLPRNVEFSPSRRRRRSRRAPQRLHRSRRLLGCAHYDAEAAVLKRAVRGWFGSYGTAGSNCRVSGHRLPNREQSRHGFGQDGPETHIIYEIPGYDRPRTPTQALKRIPVAGWETTINGIIMEGPSGRFVVSRDNQDGIRIKG